MYADAMTKLNFCNYLATAGTLLATVVVVVACVAVAGGSLAAAQTPTPVATSAPASPTPVHLPQPPAAPTTRPHAAAQAHPAATSAAAAPQAPTDPIVPASELDTLRITNALQDFQLNQATIKDAQGQVEPMRQTLIHSIASAASDLHLTPDYQWDFQQKKFIKQAAAPAATAPVTGQAVKK